MPPRSRGNPTTPSDAHRDLLEPDAVKAARPVLRAPRLGNEPGLPEGARDQGGEQVKLVAVFDHAEHLALAQVEVVDGDELAAFAPVLNIVPALRGAVVT